jgi:hypothetical protein
MLRESPFSKAIDTTEEKGRQQLETAIENQMSTLGVKGTVGEGLEETKAQAGAKLKEELGQVGGTTGWVNEAKNDLAGHQLLINNAINPETTNIPITNLFGELRTALTPVSGADSTLAPGTKKLFDDLNHDYLTAGTPPGTMSLAAIQAWKRHIGDMLDTSLFANSDAPSRDLNIIWGKLSDAEKLAYKGTAFEDQFNNLQQGWKEYFNNREYVKKLIDDNISPGQSISDLLNQKSQDGEKLKRIFELVPDARNEVAAYYLKNMGAGTDGQFNPDRFFKQWNNSRVMSPEAKVELFKGPNGDIPAIYDKLALMAQEQARSEAAKNPSRTAVVNELFRLTRHFAGVAVGYGAYKYNQTDDTYESAKGGLEAGTAAYMAALMVGPKLFTNPAFVRLLGTNPPLKNLPTTLRAFAAANPSIAPEVTALQNYISAKGQEANPSDIPADMPWPKNSPKFMGGGSVTFPDQSSNGYPELPAGSWNGEHFNPPAPMAGGGPTAQWLKMRGGGTVASPFGMTNNGGIIGYAGGGQIIPTAEEEVEKEYRNNPDLAILDRVMPNWRNGYKEEDLHTPLTPNQRAGEDALIKETLSTPDAEKRDKPIEKLLDYNFNKVDNPGPKVYPPDPSFGEIVNSPNPEQLSYYAQGGISHNIDDPRPFYNAQLPRVNGGYAEGGHIEASAMGYADGGATDNASILDRLIPGWQATGIPEEFATKTPLSPNDRAGQEAYQQEEKAAKGHPNRDTGMDQLGDYLANPDKDPRGYAEGGTARGYTLSDMKTLATNAGFKGADADKMAAIAMVESSGNPGAHNTRGEDSYGLTQVNAHAWGPIAKQALDPQKAFELAYMIKQKQGWGAWRNSLGPAAQYLNGESIVADKGQSSRSHRVQEEAKPTSVLDNFLVGATPEEEPPVAQQEEPNGNLMEVINAAPWANPETKFAAKHILAEA